MNIRLLIAMCFISILFSGCAASVTPRYSLYTNNLMDLKEVASKSNVKLKVNPFASSVINNEAVSCRGGDTVPPDGKTFSAFIKNALVDELRVGGMYSGDSHVQVNGDLKKLELHTISKNGVWIIKLEVSLGRGKPFLISVDKAFSNRFIGTDACANARDAFIPAVQDIINRIINHPKFKSALLLNTLKVR